MARPPRSGARARPAAAVLALLALAAAAGGCRDDGATPPPSVLVITLDTTRADRLGCYGKADAGTPNLDALAARGVLHERAYTVAPITLPAHASIFTGTYPIWHGVRDNGSFRLDDRIDTLAETLGDHGWRTGAFVAAYPVARGFGLEQGFEIYDDDFGHEDGERRFSRPERRAEVVVASALDWLGALRDDEPFLAWVHVFDPHAVWEPPPPYDARFAHDPYQGEVAYSDHALGALFDWLDATGRRDSTLIVVVADHGEGLGDHGEETHGALIYDSTMHVPLILAGPGVPAGVRDPRIVRVIDILPTVTELLGLDAPPDVQGRSLTHAWRGRDEGPRTAYLETQWPRLQHGWSDLRGIVDGGWKLIEAPGARDHEPEVFDIATDPGETRDVQARDADRSRELRATMQATFDDHASAGAFDAERSLSPEDEQKLRALGYIGNEPDDPRHFGRHPRDMLQVLFGYVQVANHVRAGRLEEALRMLDALERLDPDGLGLHEHRGMVYQDMGLRGDPAAYALAIESFKRALAINDRREDIWMDLGEAYRARGEFAEAVACYERSMAIATPSDDVRVNYAGLLANAGRLDEGIAGLETFLEQKPRDARGRLMLATLLAAAQRNDAALAAFDRTVAVAGPEAPERLAAHKMASVLCRQLGRTDEALRHLEAAAALDPGDPEIRAALERTRTQSGERTR